MPKTLTFIPEDPASQYERVEQMENDGDGSTYEPSTNPSKPTSLAANDGDDMVNSPSDDASNSLVSCTI
jgi:hypothetical protein